MHLAPSLRAVLVAATLLCAPGGALAVDWSALADVRVPQLMTQNADGSVRVTKLWLVVVDGQGYLRTGNTRWFRNIERVPDVSLGTAGELHPLHARPVTEPALRERVNAAFRAKYGWQDRLVHPCGASDAKILRLDPRP